MESIKRYSRNRKQILEFMLKRIREPLEYYGFEAKTYVENVLEEELILQENEKTAMEQVFLDVPSEELIQSAIEHMQIMMVIVTGITLSDGRI